MLLEKKENNMVNGDIEQYKKMNGNKRPASTEPHDDVSTPKKPHMETLKSASNGDSSATSPPNSNSGSGNSLQSIPEGSQMSTTAGGQQVVTTPDGKQMIVKMTANGSPMVIGTIEATPTGTPSPPPTASAVTTMSPAPASPVPQQQPQTPPPAASRPHVNGQVNGNSSSSLSPESPKSNSSTSSTSATSPPTSTSSLSVTTVPKPNPALPFLCEWQGCMKAFKTPKEVEKHAIATHCPLGSDDIPCLWQRCDAMKRKRFSLMTHLQDRHCHPQVCREK